MQPILQANGIRAKRASRDTINNAMAHCSSEIFCSSPAGTSCYFSEAGKSEPPTGNHTPHNGQPQRRAPLRRRPPLPAVRPAVRGGYRRSGRLHAPEAARTGPVSAFRPYFSWTPQGQWFNGQNGHFSCQPGRNRDGTPPGPCGSGFNGPSFFSRGLATDGPWPLAPGFIVYSL